MYNVIINWYRFQNALKLKIQSKQPREGMEGVEGVMGVMKVGVMEGEEDLMAEAEVMVVVAVETAETEVLWLW